MVSARAVAASSSATQQASAKPRSICTSPFPRRRLKCGLVLPAKQRVKKTVMVAVGQQLSVVGGMEERGVAMRFEKTSDAFGILLGEYRASGIQQFTTSGKH